MIYVNNMNNLQMSIDDKILLGKKTVDDELKNIV